METTLSNLKICTFEILPRMRENRFLGMLKQATYYLVGNPLEINALFLHHAAGGSSRSCGCYCSVAVCLQTPEFLGRFMPPASSIGQNERPGTF